MRWTAAALVAFAVAGATTGWAQNGLQRFESEVKPQFELKQFTYSGASALGNSGFVLNDVVAVMPANAATGDKESTVKIDRVTVEEIDFDRLSKDAKGDQLPRFAKLKLEGVTGDEAIGELLQPYGIPRVPTDLVLDYRLDPATKVMTLGKAELALRGQARLALALTLEGISDKTEEVQGAKDEGRLRAAALELDNSGLLSKLLPALAKESGLAVEPLIAAALAQIGMFAQMQGPETTKALDAVVSFITDWRQPKGPIKVSVRPAKTAAFSDLDKLAVPNALTDLFGLTVEYPGTRPGAALAASGPAPIAPSVPPAGGSGALSGAAAWQSVVGNTLTGDIDGEVIHEHYRKDGTLSLLQGADITSGRWSIEGERACFKYPDEDKECYSVQRTGDLVTLVSSKGKSFQLTVLAGNPKNL